MQCFISSLQIYFSILKSFLHKIISPLDCHKVINTCIVIEVPRDSLLHTMTKEILKYFMMGKFCVSALFRNRLIVFLFFLPGYALKCNVCFSVKGWDDCKNNVNEITCLDRYDHCFKLDVKYEISGFKSEVFFKGCAASSQCSDKNCKKLAPSAKIFNCEFECCKGDLCNGA